MDTGTNIDSELENEGIEQTEILMFDTSSGISEEEQREILGKINAITAKNRISPSLVTLKVQAKKQGSLLPILVNSAALFLLGGGLFLLSTLHQRDTLKFRQEPPLYFGSMEHQLIQEIRKETLDTISTKDWEIADITAKLTEIDRDLYNLQNLMDKKLQEKEAELREQMNREIEKERRRLIEKNISDTAVVEEMRIFEEQEDVWLKVELTDFKKQLNIERLTSKAQLEKLQEEYRHTLTQLQAERVQILEASYIREENLQAQLQEKTGELNTLYQQNRQDMGSAMDEIHRLTDTWERSVLIEQEMSGFYTALNNQIREGQMSEAAKTLATMREFLNTPAFQNLSSIQSRKEFYTASINVLSEIIEGSFLRNPLQEPSMPVLPSAAESIVEKNIIAELKAQNLALEQIIGEQDKTIANFNSQRSSQRQLSGNYENTINILRQQNAGLQQTLSTNEITINELKTQNTNLQQTVSIRDNTIDELRIQNTALQQTVSTRDSAIGELRTQNNSLQQTVEQLHQTNDAVRKLLNNQ